jgi:membrane-associated phospholipid phosphatase
MKDIVFKRPAYFYILFIPFLILGGVAMYMTRKPDLFLEINRHYSPIADVFFFWNTSLGNGIVFIVFCLVVFWRNIGYGILSLITFTLSAIIPQFLKKVIFPDVVRPFKFFQGDPSMHWVEGVELHSMNSFPSGHSVSIFALAFLATMLVKNKAWGLLFAFIAIITAYSRVYLAQHFFEDIYAGGCIGVICTMLTFLIFEKLITGNKKLDRKLF